MSNPNAPLAKNASVSHLGGKRENQSLVRVENEQGVVFTYSREERAAIVDHINRVLKDDEDLPNMLDPWPMNPHGDQIFDAVENGVLSCKLISAVGAEPIPKSLYTTKISQGGQARFQKTENHVAALKFAQENGIRVVSMGPTDFMERKVSLILGLLWQVVRLDLFNGVRDIADALGLEGGLGPEAILLRWVNQQLEEAGHARRMENFSADVKDSEIYTVLLHQLDGKCSLSPLQEKDPYKRAALMLEQAKKVDCAKFINAHDVVEGNARLNTAFVANLFAVFNAVEDEPEPEEESSSEDEFIEEDIDPSDIEKLEAQVRKLQEKYEREEKEAKMKEEISREARAALEQRADELRAQLDAERGKQNTDLKESDDRIRALREKLRQMEREDSKAGDTTELQAELLKFENEKAEIVAAQRKMEEEYADLQEDLEEKEHEREMAEEKRDRAIEDLRKTQVLHKTRIARLRQRLVSQKQENEDLEDELDERIDEREEAEDNLWQLNRKEKMVTAEMAQVQSSRDRIARTKHLLEMRMKQAERELDEEKKTQSEQTHINVKKSAKHTKLTTLEYELRAKKADVSIRLHSEEAIVEDMKFELEDAVDEKIRAKQIHTELKDDVFELEQDLEYADESKLDDVRRLALQQKRQVERAKAAMDKAKRKAAAPVQKMKDEAAKVSEKIEAEEAQQAALQLEKERAEQEAMQLGKDLLEATTNKQIAKEEKKHAKKSLTKTEAARQEEKRQAHEAKREAHQAALKAKKAERQAANTEIEQRALALDQADIEARAEQAKLELEATESAADELARQARAAKAEKKQYARELKEQEGKADKAVKDIEQQAAREAARLERQAAMSQKKAQSAAENAKLTAQELEEAREEAERKERKDTAQADAASRKDRDVQNQLKVKREQREEAERAKRKFEKQLADAAKFAAPVKSPNSKRRSRGGSRSGTPDKSVESLTKTKAQLAEEKRELEERVATTEAELKSRQTDTSSHSAAVQDFEAEFAAFQEEFSTDVSRKKDSIKAKAKAEKDAARRRRRKEKSKLDREARSLENQMAELQAQLELERELKDAALKS